MKNLILINGTMGVGKTSTASELQKMLPRNVFLDGDWCWNMVPFVVNEETKAMVNRNITYLLNNFLNCAEYENVIFAWVMHEQIIIDDILSKLDLTKCRLFVFSLTCSEASLIKRIRADIENGKRTEDVLKRTLPRLKKYDAINSVKIDVGDISVSDAAAKIKSIVESK